jgi:23S rRNA (cytosine1962-C5)-methyltransferase
VDVTVVKLRPRADARVRNGHRWVFSNEIADDVGNLPRGGVVDVVDGRGRFVGRGFANPASLIAVRLLTGTKEDIDHPSFFAARLREAVAYRAAVCPGRTSMRLVHGESDGLPGLIVDRYADVLAVQIHSLGMEVRKEQLAAAFQEVVGPRSVVLRSPERLRNLEGLGPDTGLWFGKAPGEVEIEENGVRFLVDPLGSQKTGHFFDQAENRARVGALASGRSVLDVFANTGGFALHALKRGAESATLVDGKEENLVRAVENARRNGLPEPVCLQGDAREALSALVGDGRRFGMVVLDPPAFAKARRSVAPALHGYEEINALGATLVESGGLLVTASCSHHVLEDRFLEAVTDGLRKAGRTARLVFRGEQAPDHPVLPSMPETRYLKLLVLHLR